MKYSDEFKNKVSDLYKSGLSTQKIADALNVKRGTIDYILKKRGELKNKRDCQRKYTFNETFFDVIDTEEKAYWLGFLYADGCVQHRNDSDTYTLDLALSSHDKNHLEAFKKSLNSTNPIKDYLSGGNMSGYPVSKISIVSKELCLQLINKGCTERKSNTLKFPDKSIFTNNDLIRHFIRGYFDGDGSVFISNEKHWRNGTITKVIHYRFVGTEDFLNEINNQIGLSGNLTHSKNTGKAAELCFKRKKKLIPFYKYLYENATIWLSRKREIFENYILEECSETIINQLNELKG